MKIKNRTHLSKSGSIQLGYYTMLRVVGASLQSDRSKVEISREDPNARQGLCPFTRDLFPKHVTNCLPYGSVKSLDGHDGAKWWTGNNLRCVLVYEHHFRDDVGSNRRETTERVLILW